MSAAVPCSHVGNPNHAFGTKKRSATTSMLVFAPSCENPPPGWVSTERERRRFALITARISALLATYRRPNARIADVAFDVTLTEKTMATPQARRFFQADFKPAGVVVIRRDSLEVVQPWPHPAEDETMNADGSNPHYNPNLYIAGSPGRYPRSPWRDGTGRAYVRRPAWILSQPHHRHSVSSADKRFAARSEQARRGTPCRADRPCRAREDAFAADQDDTNGKTDEGRALLFARRISQAVRRGRVEAKLPDEDGEISGD
jgi:hypothetical protein